MRTVPEPSTVLGTLVVGTLGAGLLRNRKQRQTQ
ncbi:PEP-CTERM sorting domain-containing protein [Leptolyngbya sp. FACHB-671]|nr:PEP-CTERM sorting domain-containing protein [Leptolyngbya sp. FACHB-671]